MKYAPPTWAQASGHASFTVFFRVKFYVENVNQLRDPLTLHLYYLQLRQDLLGQSHSMQYCAGSPMYLDTYSSLFFPLLSLVLFITHLSPPLPPPPLPPLPITFSSLPHPLLLTPPPHPEGKMFCHEDPALELAALALQAEKGDCDLQRAHFRLEDYVPSRVSHQLGCTLT